MSLSTKKPRFITNLWIVRLYMLYICWCFPVAACGMWEFPLQGLNSRLKSWGPYTHPQSYSKGYKLDTAILLLLTLAEC